MVKAASIGGFQTKVALVGDDGLLSLDGTERVQGTWKPVSVELSSATAAALQLELMRLKPLQSALQQLIIESMGNSRVG